MSPQRENSAASDEQRELVKSIFFKAVELPPAERAEYLAESCSGQPELRSEVEDLLQYASDELPTFRALPVFSTGQRIAGRFEIVRLVGEGGMGQVYEALDMEFLRDSKSVSAARVALKTIRPEFSGDSGIESRFLQELILSRKVGHPNVCSVFDIGRHRLGDEPGTLFLSMEFLDGETLAERLKRGRLDRVLAYDLIQQLFAGLEEVHRHGIVHRDLKPANIHLVADERERLRLVVTDFGLARSLAPLGPTVTRVLAGTPGYTAPEQFETGECSVSTDIYSLGVILYEVATGESYDAINARGILRRQAPEWADVICRCMDRNPKRRPESVQQVAASFSKPQKIRITPAMRKFALVSAALFFVLLVAWTAASFGKGSEVRTPAEFTRVTFDRGLSTEPSVAADGRRMVYSSDRSSNGVFAIWRHDLRDASDIQITKTDAHATSPAISPDGKWIVYRSEREGGGIYLVSADGGPERLIAPSGRHPSFSPDGHRVLYWTGQEGDYSAPTARSWIVEWETGARWQLHPDFADARFPVWSSDGQKILFRGSRDNSVRWDEATDWWVSDTRSDPIKTGAYDLLKASNIRVHDSRVFWADGRIFFGGRSGHSTNLWSIPISSRTNHASGPPTSLTTGTEIEIAPWRLPDGSIAFSQKRSLGNVLRIPLRGGRAGGPEQISHDEALDTRPTISADGATLLFTRRLGEIRNIMVKDLRTGEQKSMLRDQQAIPFISPDGKTIGYSLENRNTLYSLATEDGEQKTICSDCGEMAGWTFDNGRLLYLTGSVGSIRSLATVDINTHVRRFLLSSVDGLADTSLSPDGHSIAFSVRSEGTRSRIYVARVPPTGAVARTTWIPITPETSWADKPRWSTDGRSVYFFSEQDGFVCVWRTMIDSDGKPGAFTPVYHNHEGRYDMHHLSRPAHGLGVSNDAVVLNVPNVSGNVWLLRTRERRNLRPFFSFSFSLLD